ncbi:MAG: Tetrahydromethanopterin S-methyltransferase subunit D [Candidatus Methanolliviera sp. GoM_asphalt]|nr:MAG: Tetrahydromethanopterin S-methyltransferase subunit D [Candidatus Methanolliviera sp. GoM_asphalt]
MDLIVLFICIVAGGILTSIGVHMMPVGGAPAAMGTATGIATGVTMISTGAAMTGLFTASTVETMTSNIWLVALSGAVGSMLMMAFTMLGGNIIYILAAGIVPVSGRVDVDPITKRPFLPFKTPQTDGHGTPDVSYISGVMGAFLGGSGGALIYYGLVNYADFSAPLAGISAMGIFLTNAVLSAYNIGGTIEGFHDPKFKLLPRALKACFIGSLICAVFASLISYAGGL